ncbi:hypothetical protein B0F90DRAFT_1735930 [Multifurca ochricompacta]|uniref:L domain-like protein n=1 Tax=Multifurca ochricompacta TaxID=376703 RepID=A0AAD4M0R9_9AGAM|nr:hypothetical protein B0F90DRAFT_1735930 [Multifurca ochricompacta]
MSRYNTSSKSPGPLKSRLPVSSSSTRLATSRSTTHLPDPTPSLTTSPSTPRVPKSPAIRPRTISTNAKPSSSSSFLTPSSERPRTKSPTKPPTRLRPNEPEQATPSKAPPMSMKEAIALKRAEAKKAMTVQKATTARDRLNGYDGVDDASPAAGGTPATEGDDLGRPSIRDTIERARSSGSLNIASRDLPCLPSALFEIHLSVTPEKLLSVPDEPPLPEKPGRKASSKPTSWYDQQDLTFLRARNNQIVEIQPEISLFGSLKAIDLQNNRLTSLPDSFADLTSLVNLDLSHNALTSLPAHFFSLPALSTLDLSHNSLSALPFNMPFDPATKVPASSRRSSDFFSAPEITRATRPLPRLSSLDASHNKIVSSAIHHDELPQDLKTFILTYNPLGDAATLVTSLSILPQLVELRMSKCDIDDASFSGSLVSTINAHSFPKLAILDLEETRVTQAAVSSAFSALVQTIDFEAPINDARAVPAGTLAVAVGKRIVREVWEIEADRHVQRLREKRSTANLNAASASVPSQSPLRPVVKEQWEIDAEEGLFSEGARRRARAEAVQRAIEEPGAGLPTIVTPDTPPVLDRFWDSRTLTLTLPPSAGRSMRHGADTTTDEILPRATLPLVLIVTQPFADTLRVLELRGRRVEPAFVLPSQTTLNLEGCALDDFIPGAGPNEGGTLGVLAQLFPSLRNLELAYNNLTGAKMARVALEQLLFVGDDGRRAGLRRLGLCGNKIEVLDGLRELAQAVFGADADAGDGGGSGELRRRWTLEELDIRENSIAVLPGELGLLPLDQLLVDGNLFRVPPRRVWEREGTKGLLVWLKGRLGL